MSFLNSPGGSCQRLFWQPHRERVDLLPGFAVSRLAALLADQVMAAQAASQPVPKAHINALLDAAILLDKYEADLPESLGKIVDQIGDAEAEGAGRLAWLFRPFQGTRG